MVCVELDKDFINEKGINEPKFKILFRVEIPRTEFTYVKAVRKIIELNDKYNFDHIILDRGYGEVQIEMLKEEGIKRPHTGLAEKVEGFQFSEKIKVRDPYTGMMDDKHIKPFMVNNSVNIFEKGKIVMHPHDPEIVDQFGKYKIKSISSSGLPTFSSEDEHMVDATNLALLSFAIHYDDLIRRVIASKVIVLNNPVQGKEEKEVKSRRIPSTQKSSVQVIGIGGRSSRYRSPYRNPLSDSTFRRGF